MSFYFSVAEVNASQSVNFDFFCEESQHPTEEVASSPSSNKQSKISSETASECENEKGNEPDSVKEEKHHRVKKYYRINSRCKFFAKSLIKIFIFVKKFQMN